MWTAPWPEPIGESQKVFLINLGEDGDHRLLDNLVLQCGNPQWTLLPIGLRNVDSPCGWRAIRSAVDPAVPSDKPLCQAGFILVPRHAIDSGSCPSLEGIEAGSKEIDSAMVE